VVAASGFNHLGSPPHAWGHRRLGACFPSFGRFTPTRVGTSLLDQLYTLSETVHPHTRGDIILFVSLRSEKNGSPPHAWGHRLRLLLLRRGFRFTPTRVGTSRLLQMIWPWSTVHPHTRGDIY